jgi:hypothetical protein
MDCKIWIGTESEKETIMNKTMPLTLRVFTLKTCANCPAAKKIVRDVAEEFNIEFLEVDMGTPNGQIEGLMYQIMSTPSIALGEEIVARGKLISKEELKAHVRKRLGK